MKEQTNIKNHMHNPTNMYKLIQLYLQNNNDNAQENLNINYQFSSLILEINTLLTITLDFQK